MASEPPGRSPLVRRTFVNQERLIGTDDYGTEYRLWHVQQGDLFVPVRKAQGAQAAVHDPCDRLPPGVMSRQVTELALAPGTPIMLLICRPKAVRLPKRERRKFWLTRAGQLSRQPPTRTDAAISTSEAPPAERLPQRQREELAKNILRQLEGEPRAASATASTRSR